MVQIGGRAIAIGKGQLIGAVTTSDRVSNRQIARCHDQVIATAGKNGIRPCAKRNRVVTIASRYRIRSRCQGDRIVPNTTINGVVTRASNDRIVTASPDQSIIASIAENGVSAGTAGDFIVPG